MAQPNIDIPPLFKYSFHLYRKYASFVIGVMTTYFILGIVPQVYMLVYAPKEPTTESQIISIIILLVQLFLSLGFTKIMLYLVDERPVEINDLVNNGHIFFSYVVAYFMFMLAVGVGLLLLVIPGIYLLIRLQFYPYYIIEYGDPSYVALQKSWFATENFTLELLLLGICVLAANIVGAFFFGFGVIFTYPLTTMATAIVFKGFEDEANRIPTEEYYL
jgi:hypothetical protein